MKLRIGKPTKMWAIASGQEIQNSYAELPLLYASKEKAEGCCYLADTVERVLVTVERVKKMPKLAVGWKTKRNREGEITATFAGPKKRKGAGRG